MSDQQIQISHDFVFSEVENLLKIAPVEQRDNRWHDEYKALVMFEASLKRRAMINAGHAAVISEFFQRVKN